MHPLRIRANKSPFSDVFDIGVKEARERGNPSWWLDGASTSLSHIPMPWAQVPEGAVAPVAFHLVPDAAQELMDDLWRCGIRPTEGAGTAGSMAAVQEHLKDMRAIVAKELKVDLK